MNTATQPDTSWDYRTTKELVAALQARKISAIELTDHVIARIEALDPKINAVVVRDFDRGREAAKATDVALSRGDIQYEFHRSDRTLTNAGSMVEASLQRQL
jgi:amidase